MHDILSLYYYYKCSMQGLHDISFQHCGHDVKMHYRAKSTNTSFTPSAGIHFVFARKRVIGDVCLSVVFPSACDVRGHERTIVGALSPCCLAKLALVGAGGKQKQNMSTTESCDPGVNADWIHSHCRQKPDVSKLLWFKASWYMEFLASEWHASSGCTVNNQSQ